VPIGTRRTFDYALAAALATAALLLRKLLPIEPGVGLYPLPLSAIIVSAWRGGRGPGALATFISAAGIAFWLLPPLHPLGGDASATVGFAIFVAVAVLATEFSMARRRAQEALRRSQAYLAESQTLSHTGSWAGVPSGGIRYLSDECRRLLGLPPGGEPRGRIGDALLRNVHPDDAAGASAQLERALAQGADFELEYRVVRDGGAVRDIYLVGHSTRDPAGKVTEFIGSLVDVTERNLAERERERLRQAQADLERIDRVSTMGELAASLAHEIRQPIAAALTNARTCLRWLDREVPDLAEARAAASRAADDSNRVAEIVSRVRSLFQRATPRREPTDLNLVVQEIVSVLRVEANRHAVTVRSVLGPALPPVLADRVQLQQVLLNLIVNAIDAMKGAPPPRALTIATRAGEGGCVVSVSDTGPGLPTDQPDRIFDAFFTTKPDGTGMGLAISRSIVESHGGKLWAEPGSDRGATFHFTIPTASEAP
jgi:PAS domain S-box-containing protein